MFEAGYADCHKVVAWSGSWYDDAHADCAWYLVTVGGCEGYTDDDGRSRPKGCMQWTITWSITSHKQAQANDICMSILDFFFGGGLLKFYEEFRLFTNNIEAASVFRRVSNKVIFKQRNALKK